MPIHQPAGDKPDATGGDSPSRAPNPFAVPGALEPTVSHHASPSPPAAGSHPEEELDWSQIVDQFPFGLIVLGPGHELMHENAVCKRLLGLTVRETGGIESWLGELAPDDSHRERIIDSFREHIWRNQLTRTFSLRAATGKLREIEFRSSLNRDGGITIVLQDVTETLRAQEAQRHGKLKFRALFAGTENGAILADRTDRIIDANPAFLDLVNLPLRDIRRSAFAELLHPEDASLLEGTASRSLLLEEDSTPTSLLVRLRTRDEEKKIRITLHPIGENRNDPSMWLYLLEVPGRKEDSALAERLQNVARKAKSLLDAVPDLIFLIHEDLTIADFAPPPHPWEELEMKDSWRGKAVSAIWPALGDLLSPERVTQLYQGKTVRADLYGQEGGNSQFGVTLSSAGEGQLLAVIRNDSELRRLRVAKSHLSRLFDFADRPAVISDGTGTILAANEAIQNLVQGQNASLIGEPLTKLLDETSCMLVAQHLPSGQSLGKSSAFHGVVRRSVDPPLETFLEVSSLSKVGEPVTFLLSIATSPGSSAGFEAETSQHQFRNQLQMVTSLFSIEARQFREDESLLKWHLRLRSLACAIPSREPLTPHLLIRGVIEEAARLLQLGPSERLVSVEADYDPELDEKQATPIALLIGELVRLVLSRRKSGSLPRLLFALKKSPDNTLEIQFSPQNLESDAFLANETETIQLLISQMGGRIDPSHEGAHRGWTYRFPF
ncbi:MAG: PAS domain-containing protein [Verrucomicrobiota bacterium]